MFLYEKPAGFCETGGFDFTGKARAEMDVPSPL